MNLSAFEIALRRRFGEFKKTNNEYQVNCPKCAERAGKPDTKKHLYINPTKQFYVNNELVQGVWNCFRCSWKGRGLLNLGIEVSTILTQPIKTEQPKQVDLKYPEGFTTDFSKNLIGQACYNYYKSRGLSDEILRKYNFGYCFSGKYRGFIIMPVYNNKKLVYFVARSIFGKQYKNAPVPNKHILFNFKNQKNIILCEGIFDALSFPECGVALLGKQLTQEKFELLISGNPEKVYICLDTDAKLKAVEMAKKLRSYVDNVYVVDLKGKKDPNTMNRVELIESLKQARIIHNDSDLVKCLLR